MPLSDVLVAKRAPSIAFSHGRQLLERRTRKPALPDRLSPTRSTEDPRTRSGLESEPSNPRRLRSYPVSVARPTDESRVFPALETPVETTAPLSLRCPKAPRQQPPWFHVARRSLRPMPFRASRPSEARSDQPLQPTFSVFKDEHPRLVWLPHTKCMRRIVRFTSSDSLRRVNRDIVGAFSSPSDPALTEPLTLRRNRLPRNPFEPRACRHREQFRPHVP